MTRWGDYTSVAKGDQIASYGCHKQSGGTKISTMDRTTYSAMDSLGGPILGGGWGEDQMKYDRSAHALGVAPTYWK